VSPARNFDPQRALQLAAQTFEIEARALHALATRQGDGFTRSVQAMLECRGRVIVMGMGKSGHVGRKIAATLASTGTPAFFVHPAEAGHGDLGMVMAGDVVLAISNSGESDELAALLPALKRLSLTLVAMTGNEESTLARHADIVLSSKVDQEACPLNLAPTASTTAQMALGDALAVALMEHRAFTPDDFRGLHPGGRLGARLATVANLMHSGDEVPLIGPAAPMAEALIVMTQKGFGVVGVVDAAGALVGIITDGDLRRKMQGLLGHSVGEVMTRDPRTIATTALASEALKVMNAAKITTLFATEPAAPGRPAGILHVHDCLRAGVS
jgi:arabinose-5-phosphate isomerase